MKRLLTMLLAALLALGCAACGGGADEEPNGGAADGKPAPGQAGQTATAAGETAERLTMSVDRSTGKLSVKRVPLSADKKIGDAGKWTIFVYLCGTDLETENGSATDDLIEMCDGAVGAGVRFVIETGGADEWLNNTVDAGKLQRYLVEDENIECVDERPLAGMGREETLEDFLRWGVKEYASEHMGVVIWNHGGGSITGVCFDETDDYISLTLRDLDDAFSAVCGDMGRKFDFIGFDACLMGTLETANILASYSDYMIASQETESGTGWSYTAIGRYLGKTPGTDAKQLGVVVCDSFYEDCVEIEDDELCTLSVIDLSRIDDLLVSFNDFAHGLYDSAADAAVCAEMLRGIAQADNFGGNNKAEGYTNMVDMGGVISACSGYASGAQEALDALDKAVVYSVNGSSHQNASGLSMYYPLSIQGSEELSVFSSVCPSPYYLSFVDRQSKACIDVSAVEDYDDDEWFDSDGNWFWSLFDAFDDSDYWSYLDTYEQTGESPLITFDIEPYLDDEGDFWFALDSDGLSYAADVYGVVFQLSEDGEDVIELGQTYDLQGSWEDGIFIDDFDGWWLSLPDGQNLATYIVEDTDEYTIYTSPIRLNGKDTNLRVKMDYVNEEIVIEGAWDGISDYGAASREIVKLKDGDVILPTYTAFALESDEEYVYVGSEYTVSGKLELGYDIMDDGEYYFAFNIDDIYGDYYLTDFANFTVEDGEVYYEPD